MSLDRLTIPCSQVCGMYPVTNGGQRKAGLRFQALFTVHPLYGSYVGGMRFYVGS